MFREPHGLAAALGRRKRGIDETLSFIERPFVAQRVGQLSQHLAQDLVVTPLLESAMDGFVIRVALRQEVPLGAGVQNPEYGLQDRPGWDRLTTGSTVRHVLFGKLVSNPFPLIVAQSQHGSTYTDLPSCCQ